MVSYGDSEFREWAEENGFNDNDLKLIRKKAKGRMFLWFVLPALTLGIGSLFCAPLLFNAFRVCAWIEQGTLEPKIGCSGLLLYILLFISFFGIVPIFVWNSIKNKNTVPGSGIKSLIKKGKIGNH